MKQKRLAAVLLSLCLLLPSPAALAAGEDESPATGRGLLETEVHNAYVSGYKDGSFHPNGKITRAEAAQMFYGLLREEPEASASFSDVSDGAWYAPAVKALASLGALHGYQDGTFRPQANITRAEFVTIASHFDELLEGTQLFPDVSERHWAREYISSAVAHGWVRGYKDGSFQPESTITRAEAVTVLNAVLGRSPDPCVKDFFLSRVFSDTSPSHWAYEQICEAAVSHNHTVEDGTEFWVVPGNGGWDFSEDAVRYRDPLTGEFLSGFQAIEGYTYYFDPEDKTLLTGWTVIGGKHYLLPDPDQWLSEIAVSELLTEVNFTQADRSPEDIQYITVHYTAEPGDTAYGECLSFQKTYRAASAHYFVDETGPWRCVADKDISWHCGNDVYYHDACRNQNSIGIEMCCKKIDDLHHDSPYDSDWYFAESTVVNTTVLVRELMMKYGVPLENVVRHNDVTHKTCPAPYVNEFSAWQSFLDRVGEFQTDYDGSYPARITASELNVRTGPGASYPSVKTLKKGDVVTVLEERGSDGSRTGRWARIEGGWIRYEYICRLA